MPQFNELIGGIEVVKTFVDQAEGKTFFITGPSKGSLGAETAISLASANPQKLILAGRNEGKTSPVKKEIRKTNPKIEVTIQPVDLCDYASIRKAAADINARIGPIDVLLACAGTMAVKEFTSSADGIENQFAANYLGHFLLTNLIAGKLAKHPTFVTVTSMGYELAEVNFDDSNFKIRRTRHNRFFGPRSLDLFTSPTGWQII